MKSVEQEREREKILHSVSKLCNNCKSLPFFFAARSQTWTSCLSHQDSEDIFQVVDHVTDLRSELCLKEA